MRTLVLALCVALFVTRLPFILDAQRGAMWTIDELELTLTTGDRFLGAPHTQQHWSGASFQLVLLPIILIDSASHGVVSLDSFTLWLGEQYRSPWHWLLLARLTVAALTSFALAALVAMLAAYIGVTAAVAAVVVIATMPQIWIFSSQAVANGAALAFAIMAVVAADRPRHGTIAGAALAGLAVASRTVFLPIVPFVCAMCVRRSRRASDALRAGIVSGVAFVAACPYVWIEPLRFAKATLGNVLKPGNPIGLIASTGRAVSAASIPISMLASVAFVVAVMRHERALAGGALIALALIVVPAARAPAVEARYFLSLVLILPVFCLIVLGPPLRTWIGGQSAQAQRGFAAAALLISAFAIVRDGAAVAAASRAEKASFVQARQVVEFLDTATHWAGTHVAAPESVAVFLFEHVSAGAARRLADKADDAIASGRSERMIAAAYPLPARVVSGLRDVFNEDERTFEARMRIRAAGADKNGAELEIYGNTERAQRFGSLTRDAALAEFLDGGVDVLVLDEPIPEMPGPVRRIGRYGVFLRSR